MAGLSRLIAVPQTPLPAVTVRAGSLIQAKLHVALQARHAVQQRVASLDRRWGAAYIGNSVRCVRRRPSLIVVSGDVVVAGDVVTCDIFIDL